MRYLDHPKSMIVKFIDLLLKIQPIFTWFQVVATALKGCASSIPSFLAILYRVELGILYTFEALFADISFFLSASRALNKRINN